MFVLKTNSVKSLAIAEAISEGFNIESKYPGEVKVVKEAVAMYGLMRGQVNVWRASREAAADWLYIDNGYIGNKELRN